MSALPEDPSLATVRVAISDDAETADFAVVDDVDGMEDHRLRRDARDAVLVAISAHGFPVPGLSSTSRMMTARRIIASSSTRNDLTERDAAALVVGARGQPSASPPLRSEPARIERRVAVLADRAPRAPLTLP